MMYGACYFSLHLQDTVVSSSIINALKLRTVQCHFENNSTVNLECLAEPMDRCVGPISEIKECWDVICFIPITSYMLRIMTKR